MKISSINMLTPFQVNLIHDEISESVLVFYEHTSKTVHFVKELSKDKKELIEKQLATHCAEPMETLNFIIPAHIYENVSHARKGNKEFFGLTPEMENLSTPKTKERTR